MSILKSKMQSLVDKSIDTLSIFETTKKQLSSINLEIEAEKSYRELKIESLKSELSILDNHKTNNDKVINNIEKFFN